VSEALEKLIDLASRRGVRAEAYLLEVNETPVEFEANRLKSLSTQATSGLAVRVIDEGRLGQASSTDPERLEALLEAAVETARIGDPVEFDLAAQPLLSAESAWVEPPTDRFVALGEELIARVRTFHPDILVSAGFTVRRSRTLLATTAGAWGRRSRTTVSASLAGNLVRGEDLLEVFSYDVARDSEPDYEQLLAEVLRKLRLAEHNAPGTGGSLPVYFTARAVASTLGGLFRTLLSGQAVFQKTSPLSDKLGQVLFDERLTVYEDPAAGVAATPFDDEGTPTRAKQFIASGQVNDFYWDRAWAGRAGVAPGGNGFRGSLGRPTPAMVNLCLQPGSTPEADLIRSIENGVVVEQVLGAGQSNLLAGEFSVNLDLGYRVENGEIVGRLKNTMVAGNLFEAFGRQLADLTAERRWVGGASLLPGILFERLGVATRG
jgi:PmbA protein